MRLVIAMLTTAVAVSAVGGAHADRDQVRRQVAAVRPIAANMLVYHHAVVAYARSNPSATGAVADGSLSLPAWYRKAGGWSAIIGSGRVVATFSAMTLPSPMSQITLAAALSSSAQGDALLGISSTPGSPISSFSGGTTAPTPVGVPVGVAVAISIAG